MAKRYDPDKARPPLLAGALLYLLPIPLLPASLMAMMAGHATQALSYGAGFALAMLSATLFRKGITVEAEAARRKILRRASTIPYKLTGAIVMAVAMFIVAWSGISYGLIDSALFSVAVFTGAYLYYGFDPARKNPDISAVGITSEEVIDLIEEGEQKIAAIELARKDIKNLEFRERLEKITHGARDILKTIEEDPRDARQARKFLKVYLEGASQVTEGYARAHKNEESPALEDNFRRVLNTIETVISEQQSKMRENNLSELDVQIEVLQMQLEKEGIA